MVDPTPIVCRACGGPISDAEQVAWRCPHCGTPDELPRDLQVRTLELRRRIELRARQLTRLSAVDAALAVAFEEPGRLRPILGPTVGLLLMTLVPAVIAAPVRGVAATPLLLLGGVPLATAGAFYVGRHMYRRELRGHLQPLAPVQPGGRARCRCCGAELPREFGPLICCRHCRVHSLVTATQYIRRSHELATQTRQAAGRLREAAGHTARFGHRLDRVFGASFIAIYLLCMVLDTLLR